MSFLTILSEPEKPFSWCFTDPDTKKRYPDTVFTLVQVPDEKAKELKRKHTTIEWTRHQRDEQTDNKDFSNDVIDYAIKAWTGMKQKSRTGELTDVDCTRETKLALPEKVKAEIIRVVLGKEAGLEEPVPSKS